MALHHSEEDIQAVVTRVTQGHGIKQSQADAQIYAQKAREALYHFPASKNRDVLDELIDFVVRRNAGAKGINNMAKISLEEKFKETGGKRPYVQRLFGRIARIYDPMNRLMSFGLDRYWRARAARYLALATGETGLDLGAGTADLSIAVIRASGPGTHMIGMDITPEMLEQGRTKLARSGTTGSH